VTDIWITNIPDDVIAGLDRRAGQLGLTRAEFIRRQLSTASAGGCDVVTIESLKHVAEICEDLADGEVIAGAWR